MWLHQALLEDGTVSDLELVATAAPALLGVEGASIQVQGGADAGRSITSPGTPFVSSLEGRVSPRNRPSEQAAGSGEEVQVSIPDERRSALSQAGAAVGIRSVWSMPLRVEEWVFGALTLYTSALAPWSGAVAGGGLRMARKAESVVASAAARIRLEQMNANLWRAIESRTTIGQAQGVLMATGGMSAEEAFDLLTRASQRSHRKLREVAAEIVARRLCQCSGTGAAGEEAPRAG